MMAIIECKNTFSIAIKRKMAYSNLSKPFLVVMNIY